MKQLLVAVCICSIALIYSCEGGKKSTAVQPPVNDTINDLLYKRIVKDKDLYASTTEVFLIDTAYMNKDTLHVLTQKVQACDAENFDIFWSGMMAKSLPPQLPVKLFLLNDPACKEQHRFHLTFNAKPLRSANDSTKSGTAIIKLSGKKTGVKYSY